MHAVFVTVTVEDLEAAQANLRADVVPRVSQAPGFIAGYWLAPEGDRGNSIVVFESEEAARSAAEMLQPPPQVTIESIEIREVIAHA
jgi:heme-degrading monooxygenase HmoA